MKNLEQNQTGSGASDWEQLAEGEPKTSWDVLSEIKGDKSLDSSSENSAELADDRTASEKPKDWTPTPSFARAAELPPEDWLLEKHSEEELRAHPELRFNNINPAAFPIFRDQGEKDYKDNKLISYDVDINETLGRQTACAADLIAFLGGERKRRSETATPTDVAIYLDKSARPVRWMVDEFWDDFSKKDPLATEGPDSEPAPRPESISLAVDRLVWLNKVGVPVDTSGNLTEDYNGKDKGTRAEFIEFERAISEQPISRSDLARARVALMPAEKISEIRAGLSPERQAEFDQYNALDTEGQEGKSIPDLPDWLVDQIFATPTGLEGKHITVVDEVGHSGSTVSIAKYLIEQAVNDPTTTVDPYIFWDAPVLLIPTGNPKNPVIRMTASSPVWYNHDKNPELGKGVGDINYNYYRNQFEEAKAADTLSDADRRDAIIAPFHGRPLDPSAAEYESSAELESEIKRMAKLYRDGHILMRMPEYYNLDKYADFYENLGVAFVPEHDGVKLPPSSLVAIRKETLSRRNYL